jgi:hypothetical protein
VDGTEGAAGTDGQIWSPEVAVVVKLDGARYAGYKLVVPVQDTVDGYFEIGRLVLGPVVVFGLDYSWGRALETKPGTETQETQDRHFSTRVRSAPARTVEFGWADGVDLSQIYDGSPDYVKSSTSNGALPVASVADVPQVVEGLVRMLDGEAGQVVYLPRIPKAGAMATMVHRDDRMLGSPVGSVRIENVQGDESDDELVRVATVVLREETPRRWDG